MSAYSDKVKNIQSSNLIGYWILGEASGSTANDESSENNDAYISGATPGQTGIGDGNTCHQFDGVNDYVDFHSANFASDFDGEHLTVSMWIKVDSSSIWGSAGNWLRAFSMTAGADYLILRRNSAANTLEAVYRADYYKSLGATLTTTDWFHVCITVDTTADEYKLYVDGTQAGTTLTGLGSWSNSLDSTKCVIGAEDTSALNEWNGYLAHVAIWKTALSATDIASLATVSSTPSAQTISPSAIPSEEAVGTPTVTVGTTPPPPDTEGALLVEGTEDTTQLVVQGYTTQTQPLQAWQNSASDDLAQLTGDGRLKLGDLTMGTPNALLEVNDAITLPSSAPKRGLQSLGEIGGAISEAVAWAVHELKLLGSGDVSGIHAALRARLTMSSTGDGDTAELRAGDFEVINEEGISSAPVGQISGVRGAISNEAGAYLDKAVGIEGSIANDTGGDITEAVAFEVAVPVNDGTIDTLYGLHVPDLTQGTANYAIYTGTGLIHLGGVVEGFRSAFSAKSGNDTLTVEDNIVSVDASAAGVTITLPTAVGIDGQRYVVKKIDSSANTVLLATNGSETIDSSASYTLSAQWDAVEVVSNGSNWLII